MGNHFRLLGTLAIVLLTSLSAFAQKPTDRGQALDYTINRQNMEELVKQQAEAAPAEWVTYDVPSVHFDIDSVYGYFSLDSLRLSEDPTDTLNYNTKGIATERVTDGLNVSYRFHTKPQSIIPVVVHVIHTNDQGILEEWEQDLECDNPNVEYRSIEETVFSMNQILAYPELPGVSRNVANWQELNNPTGIDFTNKPYDGFGNITHSGIWLRLATVDPNGNPTSGVVRHNLDTDPFIQYSELSADQYETYGVNYLFEENQDNNRGIDEGKLKELTAWDPSRYLNIWLVNGINRSPETGNTSIGGYSYFPAEDLGTYDGIVVDRKNFLAAGPCSSVKNTKDGHHTFPLLMESFGRYMGLYPTYKDVDLSISSCEAISNGISQLDYNKCSTTGDFVCDTYPRPPASTIARAWVEPNSLLDPSEGWGEGYQPNQIGCSSVNARIFTVTDSPDLDTLFISVERRPANAGETGASFPWAMGAFDSPEATHVVRIQGELMSLFGKSVSNGACFNWPYGAEVVINIYQPLGTNIHPDVVDLPPLEFYFVKGENYNDPFNEANIIDEINIEGGYTQGSYTVKIQPDLYSQSDWENNLFFKVKDPDDLDGGNNYSIRNAENRLILSTLQTGRIGFTSDDPIVTKTWDIDGDGINDCPVTERIGTDSLPPVPDVGSTRFPTRESYWNKLWSNQNIWLEDLYSQSPCYDFYKDQISFSGAFASTPGNSIRPGLMYGPVPIGGLLTTSSYNYMNDAPYPKRDRFTVGQLNRMYDVLKAVRPNLYTTVELPLIHNAYNTSDWIDSFVEGTPLDENGNCIPGVSEITWCPAVPCTGPADYDTAFASCHISKLAYDLAGDSLAHYVSRQLPRLQMSDLELNATLKRTAYNEYMPVFHVRNTGGDNVTIQGLQITVQRPNGTTFSKQVDLDHTLTVEMASSGFVGENETSWLGGGPLYTNARKYFAYKFDPGFTYRFTPMLITDPGEYTITASLISSDDDYSANNERQFIFTKEFDGYVRYEGKLSRWNRTAAIEIYDSDGNLIESTKEIDHPINKTKSRIENEAYANNGFAGWSTDYTEKETTYDTRDAFLFNETTYLKPGEYTLRINPMGYSSKGQEYLYTKHNTFGLIPPSESPSDPNNYIRKYSTTNFDTYGRYALSDPILEGMWHGDWYRQRQYLTVDQNEYEYIGGDFPWEDSNTGDPLDQQGFIREKLNAYFTAWKGNDVIYSDTDTNLIYSVLSPPSYTFTIDETFTPDVTDCIDSNVDGFCDTYDPQQYIVDNKAPYLTGPHIGYFETNPGVNFTPDSVFVIALLNERNLFANENFEGGYTVETSRDPDFSTILQSNSINSSPNPYIKPIETEIYSYLGNPYRVSEIKLAAFDAGRSATSMSGGITSPGFGNIFAGADIRPLQDNNAKQRKKSIILYGVPAVDYWSLNGDVYGEPYLPNPEITSFSNTLRDGWKIDSDTLYFRLKWTALDGSPVYSEVTKLAPGGAPNTTAVTIRADLRFTQRFGTRNPILPLGCSNPNIDNVYYEGEHYNVKQFGDQCWMTDRLRATNFNSKNSWLRDYGHSDSVLVYTNTFEWDLLKSARKEPSAICNDIPPEEPTFENPLSFKDVMFHNPASITAYENYALGAGFGYFDDPDPEDVCYWFDPWAWDPTILANAEDYWADTKAGLYYNARVRQGWSAQKDYGQESRKENICPPGFRIPLMSDFIKLTDWVDSQYGNFNRGSYDFWANEFGAFLTGSDGYSGSINPGIQPPNAYQSEESFEQWTQPIGSNLILAMAGSLEKPKYGNLNYGLYGYQYNPYWTGEYGDAYFSVKKVGGNKAGIGFGSGAYLGSGGASQNQLPDLRAYQIACVSADDYSVDPAFYNTVSNPLIENEGVMDLLEDFPTRGCADPGACNYTALYNSYNVYDSLTYTTRNLDAEEKEMCLYPNECGDCGSTSIQELGYCNCDGDRYDAIGVCGGTCAQDFDGDGICDDLNSTAAFYNSCGMDQDGVTYNNHTYDVINIGDQCWFAENLRTTSYRDNTFIPTVADTDQWGNLTTGAKSSYDNDITYTTSQDAGYLYNWYAVDDSRGLCPSGWHVPTEGDWQTLELTLGMQKDEVKRVLATGRGADEEIGNMLKQDGLSKFNSKPFGYRHGEFGSFDLLGDAAWYWTSTEFDSRRFSGRDDNAYHRAIFDADKGVHRYTSSWSTQKSKKHGFSVRCIKD